MSDMIERCARAIARAEKWDNISEKTLSVYLPLARAAIEALREPTPDMIHAGAWARPPFTADKWRAMIDSALSQDTPSLPLKPQEAVNAGIGAPHSSDAGPNSGEAPE